jgi:hypothetical protein
MHWILNRFVSSEPVKKLVDEQNEMFLKLGLDREDGLLFLNSLSDKPMQCIQEKSVGMASEHLVFFSALARKNKNLQRVLEIGTFQGETSRLLGKLFPQAVVESLDLPDEERVKNKVYAYVDSMNFPSDESAVSRIKYLKQNSLRLVDFLGGYDLIWVDGNHLSPYTISDIVNSVRLMSNQGYLVCDDIYLKKPFLEVNADLSAISIIKALSKAEMISYELIRKRLGFRFNNIMSGYKYIAIIRKRN